ncbi:phenoloxidase-activating factor 3-like isoform X2 [Tenebrio molitor]
MSITGALLVFGLVALPPGSITLALKFNSPCPDLFHYDSADQPNQWTGTVTLLSDAELHGVWIRLIFDEKLTELDVPGGFGEVITHSDEREYLIKNRNFKLEGGIPKKIQIVVKYDGEKIPTLTGFRLNAEMVCSSKLTNSHQLFPGDLNNKDFLAYITSSLPASEYKEFEGCGTAPLSENPKPANEKVPNGQWPWQGAIYIQRNDGEKYACEATLVSPRHVLTPAHCVTYQKSELAVPIRQLKVYLGKYSHNHDEENRETQKLGVEKVVLYPGYRSRGLLNDLSVIQLDKPVIISDYVRPICLSRSLDKKEGFLVGYGISQDKVEDLGQARVKIIGDEECQERHSDLKGLLTDNVFCTSYVEDNSVCVGDSGSSLASLRDGLKPVWELKGVVTVGVVLQNKYVCNRSSTVLLVDVANYLKWIQAVIS